MTEFDSWPKKKKTFLSSYLKDIIETRVQHD